MKKESKLSKHLSTGPKEKLEKLKQNLKDLSSLLISYSGGTDSTLLLYVANETVENLMAVTATSKIYPTSETEKAKKTASEIGVQHETIETGNLESEKFRKNSPDRCYYCKHNLYQKLWEIAEEHDIKHIADGTNFDDLGKRRPGREAAVELNVLSPLAEVGLTKSEIRDLSKELGLSTWDEPSNACLATRIPFGTEITEDILKRLNKLENFLKDLGIEDKRVRHHDDIARIEVNSKDFELVMKNRDKIVEKFNAEEYDFVTLDLSGYEEGSMSKTL